MLQLKSIKLGGGEELFIEALYCWTFGGKKNILHVWRRALVVRQLHMPRPLTGIEGEQDVCTYLAGKTGGGEKLQLKLRFMSATPILRDPSEWWRSSPLLSTSSTYLANKIIIISAGVRMVCVFPILNIREGTCKIISSLSPPLQKNSLESFTPHWY